VPSGNNVTATQKSWAPAPRVNPQRARKPRPKPKTQNKTKSKRETHVAPATGGQMVWLSSQPNSPVVDATISLSTWPQEKQASQVADQFANGLAEPHEKPPGINRQAVENGKLCKAKAKAKIPPKNAKKTECHEWAA